MIVWIGIDIGVAGGLACIANNYARVIEMPIFKGTKGGSKSKTDIVGVNNWISDRIMDVTKVSGYQEKGHDILHGEICVTMEAVHAMPGQGVTSMFHFGESYGMLQAMALINGWKLNLVTPQAWKKDILAGTPKDKTAAVQHVRAMYPALDLNVGKKKVIYHDGMADAVCLAEYGTKISS